MLGGEAHAAGVMRERAGGAFDPVIAHLLAAEAGDILAVTEASSVWDEVLGMEPTPWLTLREDAIDRALGAMGNFADLASRYLVGHAAGVAELAGDAARRRGLPADDVVTVRRAALIHDVGRVAVPVRVWQKAAPLTPNEWEQLRLHAYHSERVLSRSPFLAALAPVATFHHERLDGTGYHRGATVVAMSPAARLLAAAGA
jgi:HD-GYP domain-containing protein (c-di-GMP phosphodiesterase class II)